jgi:hypothetical protein
MCDKLCRFIQCLSLANLSKLNDLIGFIVAFAALKVGAMILSHPRSPLTSSRYPQRKTLPATYPLAGSDPDFWVPSSTAFFFWR